MNAHQNLRLHEWIAIGKQSGKIVRLERLCWLIAWTNARCCLD